MDKHTGDIEDLTRTLRAEEAEAAEQLERSLTRARDTRDEGVPDRGDMALQTEEKDEQLREAETAREHLDEVRAALARIDAGTYGLCAVDGEPIEPERLKAVPWAQYCLKHQAMHEPPGQPGPTL